MQGWSRARHRQRCKRSGNEQTATWTDAITTSGHPSTNAGWQRNCLFGVQVAFHSLQYSCCMLHVQCSICIPGKVLHEQLDVALRATIDMHYARGRSGCPALRAA